MTVRYKGIDSIWSIIGDILCKRNSCVGEMTLTLMTRLKISMILSKNAQFPFCFTFDSQSQY